MWNQFLVLKSWRSAIWLWRSWRYCLRMPFTGFTQRKRLSTSWDWLIRLRTSRSWNRNLVSSPLSISYSATMVKSGWRNSWSSISHGLWHRRRMLRASTWSDRRECPLSIYLTLGLLAINRSSFNEAMMVIGKINTFLTILFINNGFLTEIKNPEVWAGDQNPGYFWGEAQGYYHIQGVKLLMDI